VSIEPGFFVIDPAVSTDGKKIAYGLQLPAKAGSDGKVDFGTDLYVSNRDGGEPKLVAKHSAAGESIQKPNWTPDGKGLLFEVLGVSGTGDSDFRIETMNLDSGARKRVIEGAIEPALAPDGHTFAYVRVDPLTWFESLYVGDIAGGPDRRVVPPNLPLTFYVSTTWSPDGARLAFAAANPGTAMLPATKPGTSAHPTLQDVWVVNKDGAGLHLVAELAERLPSISWTPDNASVYVLGGGGFWLIDMTSGAKQPVGDGVAQGQVWLLR
jgi:Tol biopolymer transport system component